jgi:hypothetical protein
MAATCSPRSGGVIAVYDLGRSPAPRFGPSDFIGAIRLGHAVVGSALSPDGRYLYVTSELARAVGRMGQPEANGTLSVLSVASAEHNPARATLATVPAQHEPVRVAASPDGSVVWVTARGGDHLLAFSAAKLLTDPARALIAQVTVGPPPSPAPSPKRSQSPSPTWRRKRTPGELRFPRTPDRAIHRGHASAASDERSCVPGDPVCDAAAYVCPEGERNVCAPTRSRC